jgi:hypothetical protein
MARMIVDGNQTTDTKTGAVVIREPWTRNREGSFQVIRYRLGDREWRLNAQYDEARPDLVFGKPPRWESGEPLSDDELAQARETILLALRKQGLDPLWDPPYVQNVSDWQAEQRRVSELRRKLFPKRSLVQQLRDRRA